MTAKPTFADSVFINCPFDEQYQPLFEAVVFCVVDCGFVPRCALEESDSGQVRLAKIAQLIAGSQYAIHDLSRTELDAATHLPRFNMPFELGLDLGCRTFGTGRTRRKRALIVDCKPYRYQALISDIAGQDIDCHDNSSDRAIEVVRHWLRTNSRRGSVPRASDIKRRFVAFSSALPELCERSGADREDLRFVEYVALARVWLTTP